MSENEAKESIQKEKETVLHNMKERIGKLTVISQTMLTEAQERVKTDLSVLEKKWETARGSLEKIGSTTTWQEIATGIEEAWEDLSRHFGKAISRFKKEGISFRDQWNFYQDSSQKWRWRRSDLDDQIVGTSHTGFSTREACEENARRHGYEGN